jgi:threonine/homoserine/homoserine lactone efflux protein
MMSELWGPIQGGAIAGLVIAVLIGPVFFALIQTSLEKGFLAGMTFAMGIIMSDATYFILSYFGISRLNSTGSVHTILGLAGGGFLIGFGLSMALKKVRFNAAGEAGVKSDTLLKNIGKGFLMNAINPGVLFYWLSVVGLASVKFNSNPEKIFAFFITTMTIVFCTDTLKAYLSARLKKLITENFMTWLNRISGSIIIIAGGKLFIEAVLPLILH